MVEIVREVLVGRIESTDDIKDEIATRFAAGITRQQWDLQWNQLRRFEIGLTDKDRQLPWYSHLDVYFEMRNCIIHRNGRVSPLLKKKSDYFKQKNIEMIEIWPVHLDFYRHHFIACLFYLEKKIRARFEKETLAQNSA